MVPRLHPFKKNTVQKQYFCKIVCAPFKDLAPFQMRMCSLKRVSNPWRVSNIKQLNKGWERLDKCQRMCVSIIHASKQVSKLQSESLQAHVLYIVQVPGNRIELPVTVWDSMWGMHLWVWLCEFAHSCRIHIILHPYLYTYTHIYIYTHIHILVSFSRTRSLALSLSLYLSLCIYVASNVMLCIYLSTRR